MFYYILNALFLLFYSFIHFYAILQWIGTTQWLNSFVSSQNKTFARRSYTSHLCVWSYCYIFNIFLCLIEFWVAETFTSSPQAHGLPGSNQAAEIFLLNIFKVWAYICKNGWWNIKLLGSCHFHHWVLWEELCLFFLYCRIFQHHI